MKDTVLDRLHVWSVYQPERRIDFNGVFWRRPAGNVMFDPMPLCEEQAEFVTAMGGVRAIVVSNADHWRATDELARRFGAEIAAPSADRSRLQERTTRVTRWYASAAELPASLAPDVDVHLLHGGKSSAETAFYLRPLRALLFADAVRSHVSGRLRMLPDDKLSDRARLTADLLALRDLNLQAILVGDGDCLFTGARGAFLEVLRGLSCDESPAAR